MWPIRISGALLATLASAWCSANRKQPSRKRFVNWLNRCEKPIAQTAAYAPKPQGLPEPTGWLAFARREFPDAIFFLDGACPTWKSLDAGQQRAISDRMRDTFL